MKKGLLIGIGAGIGAAGLAIGAGIATVVVKRDVKKSEEKKINTINKLKRISDELRKIERQEELDLTKVKKDISELIKELPKGVTGSEMYDKAVELEKYEEKGLNIFEAGYNLEVAIYRVLKDLRKEETI